MIPQASAPGTSTKNIQILDHSRRKYLPHFPVRHRNLLLEITAYALIGKAQEVYPSEELVLDKGKGKGKKSKILYEVDGVAGMHSQKIGNAIRTIDTWYPDYDEVNTGPIAIEPYGAVTNLGVAISQPKKQIQFLYAIRQICARRKTRNQRTGTLRHGRIGPRRCVWSPQGLGNGILS